MVNFPNIRRFFERVTPTISSFPFFRKREDTGRVVTSYSWTDRQPHPPNMVWYEEVANDPEVNIALSVHAGMIAGGGMHTEMPEGIDPDHKHKAIIDDYAERVNLDEDLKAISYVMLAKGFSPVERLADYDLKLLPPETFYIWRTKLGEVYRYTQERSQGDIIATWETPKWEQKLTKLEALYPKKEFKDLMAFEADDPSSLDDIILFINDEDSTHPYGRALTDPIIELVEARRQINQDLPVAIHRFAYPLGVIKSRLAASTIKEAFENRDLDAWISISNCATDELEWGLIEPSIRQDWIPYIELLYYQIGEALHAPLILLLKNATEASGNVMVEAVDRFVDSRQRYIKRRVERYFFEPQCKGGPVPRLVWGQPQSGLEDVTLTDIAAIVNSPKVPDNQVQYILSQFFPGLPEPEYPPEPQLPLPFQKPSQPPVPVEQWLEKAETLDTCLTILETNLREGRIPLEKACQLGGHYIKVHLQAMYSHDEFELKRREQFDAWVRRLLNMRPVGTTYSVKIE